MKTAMEVVCWLVFLAVGCAGICALHFLING